MGSFSVGEIQLRANQGTLLKGIDLFETGYTLFDAAVHYDIPNITNLKDNLRLALNATNLANKEYVASCYSYSWCWYGSQRTVQASATYQW